MFSEMLKINNRDGLSFGTTQMYNYKIIQEFKKDFWKEFI